MSASIQAMRGTNSSIRATSPSSGSLPDKARPTRLVSHRAADRRGFHPTPPRRSSAADFASVGSGFPRIDALGPCLGRRRPVEVLEGGARAGQVLLDELQVLLAPDTSHFAPVTIDSAGVTFWASVGKR